MRRWRRSGFSPTWLRRLCRDKSRPTQRTATFLALLFCALPVQAELSWDGALYGYVTQLSARPDSVLNPTNQLARLPAHLGTAEGRFNLKWEQDALRVTARPLLLNQDGGRQAYLGQWQARWRAADSLNLSAGREVLNWGAGQFRSPSSPFYFDNGRNNPLRELSGMDTLKLAWTPDRQHSLMLARITGSGHLTQNPCKNSWLLKLDLRNDDAAAGLVLANIAAQGNFIGAHGQYTASDALLLYGEIGHTARQNALQSPADSALPFSLSPRGPARATSLLGAAYTLESGQSLTLEYLHDRHGYDPAQQAAYYTRAATALPLAGLALGNAPPLLGRDYLHGVWQSNLLDSGGYARLMLSHSLTDHGWEAAAYGETVLDPHLSAFALLALPLGTPRQEFSALLSRSLLAGVKINLP